MEFFFEEIAHQKRYVMNFQGFKYFERQTDIYYVKSHNIQVFPTIMNNFILHEFPRVCILMVDNLLNLYRCE